MIDTYKEVTRRIIAELEKGVIPWHCPWRPCEWRHRNLVSGKAYRGINQILHCIMPYESPFWLTPRQLHKLGGELKPEEKGCGVVFWTLFEKAPGTKVPVLRFYTVYNVEQTLGIPQKYIPNLPPKNLIEFDPISNAEEVIAAYSDCPEIMEDYFNRKTANAKSAVLKFAIKLAGVLRFVKRFFKSPHTVCFGAHNFDFIFCDTFY